MTNQLISGPNQYLVTRENSMYLCPNEHDSTVEPNWAVINLSNRKFVSILRERDELL